MAFPRYIICPCPALAQCRPHSGNALVVLRAITPCYKDGAENFSFFPMAKTCRKWKNLQREQGRSRHGTQEPTSRMKYSLHYSLEHSLQNTL